MIRMDDTYCLVVFAMVQLHDLLRDVRFQCLNVVNFAPPTHTDSHESGY